MTTFGARAGVISETFNGSSFDANTWQVNLPTKDFSPQGLSSNPSGLASNASATVSNGVANLAGRAQLVTKQVFPTPVTISGDVKITNLGGPASDPHYNNDESFTIATRTNAGYDYGFFGEVDNSILFRAQFVSNNPAHWNFSILTSNGSSTNFLASTQADPIFGAFDTIHFTVTDDGTNVSFNLAKLVNGVPSPTGAATLTATTTLAGTGNQVAFYDRESPQSDFPPHSVSLDNVNISSVPEPGTISVVAIAAFAALRRRRSN
ncbi:MAG TPA: PEP-CTERM sorting domain-containing protein [Humisphaera sp.]|jgi:hypothetical protein|nr:PEP-CTERM sorting domain-containing protein [Humisphaera sp.]